MKREEKDLKEIVKDGVGKLSPSVSGNGGVWPCKPLPQRQEVLVQ